MRRPEIGLLAQQVHAGIDPTHMLRSHDPVEVGVLRAVATRVLKERAKANG